MHFKPNTIRRHLVPLTHPSVEYITSDPMLRNAGKCYVVTASFTVTITATTSVIIMTGSSCLFLLLIFFALKKSLTPHFLSSFNFFFLSRKVI